MGNMQKFRARSKKGFKRNLITFILIASLLVSLFGGILMKSEKVFAAAAASITISLKSKATNGKYVSSGILGTSIIAASSDSVWFGQLYDLEDLGGGDFALKSRANNLYVTVSSDFTLSATQITAGSINEKFKKTIISTNVISLQSNRNNNYISLNTSNQLIANKSSNTTRAEQFEISAPYNLNKTIRILEITESGTTDLNVNSVIGNTTNSIVTFETYSMKKYVAMRGEIDGKYDAIYFGKGIYNPTPVAAGISNTGNEHNTTAIMNDITNLKAAEIVSSYIDKGLPVIFYSDTASKNGMLFQGKIENNVLVKTPGKFYNTFARYSSSTPKSNVMFVSAADLLSTTSFLSKTNLLQAANIRPRISLTSKPIDYTENADKKYLKNESISYTFDVTNAANLKDRHLTANLYMGIDSVLAFEGGQLIATQPVTSLTNNQITFRLPQGYSGLHYWKLEIVDITNNSLKDVEVGLIRFQDKQANINVLQVVPKNEYSSSLQNSNNLKQAYLTTTDYLITISIMDIKAFNEGGYQNLNGKYDMIIFGFKDSYNNDVPIETLASAAVKSYIDTGQSVMFTHDTIFKNGNVNNQNWLNYFQNATGQIEPWTNMGYGAPKTSTTTKKINDGLLTQFPFNISNLAAEIAVTHDQYYTLNLEERKIIPWYNITGGGRDDNDSWNHYYTYSNGNVTYSGTGHTNTNFPDWEQKLFVNTMYRAFIGSNHAPSLTIYSPEAYSTTTNNYIPTYSKILVNYQADDFDLNDRLLKTTIEYKKNNESTWTAWQTDDASSTGEIMTKYFPNPLPDGGDLTIRITTTDNNKAMVTKEVSVKILNVTANVAINRSLSDNVIDNQIEKNTDLTINYTITPKAIAAKPDMDAADFIITGLKLEEILPKDMELRIVPESLTHITQTGDISKGITLNANLPDIHYKLEGNKYIAPAIEFKLTVRPKQNGIYSLNNSNLRINDFTIGSLTPVPKTLPFNNLSITGVTRMTGFTLANAEIAKGDSSKLNPSDITPIDATNKIFTFTSNRPDIVSIDPITGVFTGIDQGTAEITVTSADGSNIIRKSLVNVVTRGLNITGSDTVNIGEVANLTGVFVSSHDEHVDTVNWTISSLDSDKVKLVNTSKLTTGIEGLKLGTATITLNITTKTDGSTKIGSYSTTRTITVKNPVKTVSIVVDEKDTAGREIVSVNSGTPLNLTANILPLDADNIVYPILWSSSDHSVATIRNNTNNNNKAILTTLNAGSVTISITVGGITATKLITVRNPVQHIYMDPVITAIDVGASITLSSRLDPVNAVVNDNSYTWEIVSGSAFAKFTSAATNQSTVILKGLADGVVQVKVSNGIVSSQIYSINIYWLLTQLTLNNTTNLRPQQTIDLLKEQLIIKLNQAIIKSPDIQSSPEYLKVINSQALVWSSSKPNVVSVSTDGEIKALTTEGRATISVAYRDNRSVVASTVVSINNEDRY